MATFPHELFCPVPAMCVCWRLAVCLLQPARTKNKSKRVFLGGKESGHGNSHWVLSIDSTQGILWLKLLEDLNDGVGAPSREMPFFLKGWGLVGRAKHVLRGSINSRSTSVIHQVLGKFRVTSIHTQNPKLFPSSKMLQILLEFTRKLNSSRKSSSNSSWPLFSLVPNDDQVQAAAVQDN